MTKSNTTAAYRDATSDDTQAILNLWRRVFHEHDEGHWSILRDQLDADSDRRAIRLRVLEENSRIIAAVRNGLRSLRVGTSSVLIADVGYIAVDPDLQGRGLGHELMRDNLIHLQSQGVHIGRLGGLAEYYERFGWTRFPAFSYRLSLADARGGMKTVSFAKSLSLDETDRDCVKPFDKAAYWDDYVRMAEAFHMDHNASEMIAGDLETMLRGRRNEHELRRFVFQRDNESPTAYLFTVRPNWTSYDLGCTPGHEDDLLRLMKYFLLAAHEDGQSNIRATWPNSPMMRRLLRKLNVTHEWIEAWGGIGANMIRIVDLPALLERIRPELESVSAKPSRLAIQIDHPLRQACCDFPGGKGEITLATTQTDFVRLLFGMTPVEMLELNVTPDTADSRRIVSNLFPLRSFAGF